MARQLRIEYAGAFYHVTSRGNQKQAIFLSDDDRFYFLKCLGDAYDKFASVIHVYCLMENHYHLLIETPGGNLSKVMHSINTAYSLYFNKKHDRCGHLFQGRFKAILIQTEEYAREIGPYVHLNPVIAGLADSPEKYVWSNFREYLGTMASRPWTSTALILGAFGTSPSGASQAYLDFTIWRLKHKLPDLFKEARSSGILGTPEFTERISKLFPARAPTHERDRVRDLPQLRKIKSRPRMADIMSASERLFGPRNKNARKAAIFVTHKNTDYSLKEIGQFFKLGISGVTDVCRRAKREISANDTLARIIRDIEAHCFGS